MSKLKPFLMSFIESVKINYKWVIISAVLEIIIIIVIVALFSNKKEKKPAKAQSMAYNVNYKPETKNNEVDNMDLELEKEIPLFDNTDGPIDDGSGAKVIFDPEPEIPMAPIEEKSPWQKPVSEPEPEKEPEPVVEEKPIEEKAEPKIVVERPKKETNLVEMVKRPENAAVIAGAVALGALSLILRSKKKK